MVNESVSMLLEKQMELERQGIIKAAGTKDYLEGQDAFFEKRNPSFDGE